MSQGKALLETIIISALIPFASWMVTFYNSNWIFFPRSILLSVFIISGLAYTYVIYTRHKDQRKFFIFLTALLSTILQYIFLVVILLTALEPAGSDGHSEGHPNGDAILLLLILFAEPLLVNLFPLLIKFIKSVIWLFTDDKNADCSSDASISQNEKN